MKCPYRSGTTCQTIDEDIYMEEGHNIETHEHFEECYGEECPFYIPAQTIGAIAYCRKVEKEAQ